MSQSKVKSGSIIGAGDRVAPYDAMVYKDTDSGYTIAVDGDGNVIKKVLSSLNTDDVAIRAAVDRLDTSGNIILGLGTFTITNPIVIIGKSNFAIVGNRSTIKLCDDYKGYYTDRYAGIYVGGSSSDILIEGIIFDGNFVTITQHMEMVSLRSGTINITIDRCEFIGVYGKPLTISSEKTFVRKCSFIDNTCMDGNHCDIYTSLSSTATTFFEDLIFERSSYDPTLLCQNFYMNGGFNSYRNIYSKNCSVVFDFRTGIHTVDGFHIEHCGILLLVGQTVASPSPVVDFSNGYCHEMEGRAGTYRTAIMLVSGEGRINNVYLDQESGYSECWSGLWLVGPDLGKWIIDSCKIDGFLSYGILITDMIEYPQIIQNCNILNSPQHITSLATGIADGNVVYCRNNSASITDLSGNIYWNNNVSGTGGFRLLQIESNILELLGTPLLFIPCTTLTANLAFYDSSRHAHYLSTGVATNSTYGYKGISTYYEFDGTTQYIAELSNQTMYDFGDGVSNDYAFTIVMCIQPNVVISKQLIGKWNVVNKRQWRLFLDDSGYLTFQLFDEANDKYIGRKYSTALTVGTWYIIVATYDGSNSSEGIAIYLNGIAVDNTDYNDPGYVAMQSLVHRMTIGVLDTNGVYSEHFDGNMMHICISGKEFSEDEVWSIYKYLRSVLGI